MNDKLLKNVYETMDSMFDNIKVESVYLGGTTNAVETKTLASGKLSDYDFITLESGWGYNKTVSVMPMDRFLAITSDFDVMVTYIKIYGGAGWVSLNHINDTQFKINGAAGTDVVTTVYGLKIKK